MPSLLLIEDEETFARNVEAAGGTVHWCSTAEEAQDYPDEAKPLPVAKPAKLMLQRSEKLRERLGAAARERVDACFSLERMVRGYDELIREVIEKRRAFDRAI